MAKLATIVDNEDPLEVSKDKYGYIRHKTQRSRTRVNPYPNCCGIYIITGFGHTTTDGQSYYGANDTDANRLFDLYLFTKTAIVGQWQIALNNDQWRHWEPILLHLGFEVGKPFYHTGHGKSIKLYTFDWNEKPEHGKSTKRSFPDYFETRAKFFPHVVREAPSKEVQSGSEPVPKKKRTRSKVKSKEESPTLDHDTVNSITEILERHQIQAQQFKDAIEKDFYKDTTDGGVRTTFTRGN